MARKRKGKRKFWLNKCNGKIKEEERGKTSRGNGKIKGKDMEKILVKEMVI